MGRTDNDFTSIISKQKQEIDLLTQQLSQTVGWKSLQERAWNHVSGAIDEAIGMASRSVALLANAKDKGELRRRSEANRLLIYFRESKRNFQEVLNGYPITEKAVLENEQSPSGDTSEGAEPANS